MSVITNMTLKEFLNGYGYDLLSIYERLGRTEVVMQKVSEDISNSRARLVISKTTSEYILVYGHDKLIAKRCGGEFLTENQIEEEINGR